MHLKNHDWRRIFITDIAEKYGIDQAQMMVGHKKRSTTEVYWQKHERAKKSSEVMKYLEDRWKKRMQQDAAQTKLLGVASFSSQQKPS